MQTGKKFDDLISRAPMPKMSKGFWARFDAELGEKLDRAEVKRISVRSAVLGVLEDLGAAFSNPEFKRALATASAAVMVVGFSVIFAAKGGPGLYPVSSLTSDELVDEIVMLDAYPASENIIDF
ncbi:MAG TPA: hypothetical protein PLV09_02340 [Candidatus Omnitrophota bacterium]|nr:hypothetical protein [Candidatus Omnitrophota bacterium]HPN66238.1 hypothetical protein [Candidatus Omnitrophota bacterium]HRZ67036.1 hypothetical protein [Candidatus Omnitrophota bacterium]